jgi:hypothetical protein
MNVEPYAIGVLCLSCCAPASMSRKEVKRQVNLAHPTGISSEWDFSSDEHFADGTPNPCACEHDPERMHYLMEC